MEDKQATTGSHVAPGASPKRANTGAVGERRANVGAVAFVAVCLAVCMIPAFGMLACPTRATTENRPMAPVPALLDETGAYNMAFLQEVTDYVNDHMALRNELVYADALIQTKLFGTANVSGVVAGTDGWLYYTATLDDFLGRDVMSARELFGLARNFAIIDAYMEERGIAFVLAIPPNKNTLYGEHMPYYASGVVSTEHGAKLLGEYLARAQVSYVDLFALLEAQNEVLYQKRDSHWNTKGACLAYNALMDALGLPHETYAGASPAVVETASGDLNRMLYSFYGESEENFDYGLEGAYVVTNGAADVTAGWIITENGGGGGEGTLLMFRDSFADTLIPFFSAEFAEAYYSKGEPNALESFVERYAPTAVVIEKVERNIANYLVNPPVLTPPRVELPNKVTVERDGATVGVENCAYDVNYVAVSGAVDAEYLGVSTEIVVSVDGVAYPAWHTGEDEFLLYVKKDVFGGGAGGAGGAADVRVFVLEGTTCTQVCMETLEAVA